MYCVNCGILYEKRGGFCPSCCCDQNIPLEIINRTLDDNKRKPFGYKLNIGYPGERMALIASVVLCAFVLFVLSLVSFGVFAFLFCYSLLLLKHQEISLKNNSIKISDTQYQNIFKLSKLAAHRLNLPLIDVYIIQDNNLNAFATGFYKYGFIVLSSHLVDTFTPGELLFVLGHEMAHIKKHHITFTRLTQPAINNNFQIVLASLISFTFNIWSVKAEYTADQAGLITTRDLNAGITTMVKLAGGAYDTPDRLVNYELGNDPETFESHRNALLEYIGTHPFISNRIKRLKVFASSSVFLSTQNL